jgi:hypothetical protein
MSYKRIIFMDIYEVIRRWHSQQAISHIAEMLQYDRKTIRKYIQDAQAQGITLAEPLPPKDQVVRLLQPVITLNRRPATAQQIFEPYLEEITTLIQHPENPLKLKQAFEVLGERHDLSGKASYPSFTRFVKAHGVVQLSSPSTCRIEVEAGQEVQIDYAKMGLLWDAFSQRRKTVYAFIATLSHSRHKYVEFVYRQDQVSFVVSHVQMFDYFGGVPVRIVLDNLKSGVIKPHLYEPHFNRSYREMAEHYGCFLDPCRVADPKGKGKVERDVQTVRNQFRKLLALEPNLTLACANQKIKHWCQAEYGQKDHGTTHQKPYPLFIEQEQPALKPLPVDMFCIPKWQAVTVHADHYVQFEKKAYSVPHAYIGKKLWLRQVNKIVQLFDHDILIKQQVVTDKMRHTDFNDFPPNVQAALDTGLPAFMQGRAAIVGPSFLKLIRRVLEPHAFLNLRRAQGLIRLMDKWEHALLEQAAAYALQQNIKVQPANFKQLLQRLVDQNEPAQMALPLSEQTLTFVREMAYFIHEPR